MTYTTTTPKGKVIGHNLRERDTPWMYFDVLIRCPNGTTITKSYTVSDKADLPKKESELPLEIQNGFYIAP